MIPARDLPAFFVFLSFPALIAVLANAAHSLGVL